MNAQQKTALMNTLNQKKGLLEKMLTLTCQIKAELQRNSIDAFAEALKNREAIVSKIDVLTKAEHEWPAATDDIEVLGMKKEIRGIISRTLKQDEENMTLAQELIQKYRNQIKHLNETKKGVGRYTQPFENKDAFFVDANK